MMTIHGINISYWGVALLRDSFSSLFKYPKRKAVKYSNYAEQDGIIPDLRKYETESRTVSLKFFIRADTESEFISRYNDFCGALNGLGNCEFDFGFCYGNDQYLKFFLRYDRTQSLRTPGLFYDNTLKYGIFTTDFIEDTPSADTGASAICGMALTGLYRVDGTDFGDFGVHTNGSIGEVLKYADAKPPFDDGREKHFGTRNLKHKEVTIPLWIHAGSQSVFIQNWQAFYGAFARPGMRSLHIREVDATVDCYYADCPSYTIKWGSRVGAFFSIKIVIPAVTWL
jgi:hypothetical protein